MSHRHQRSDMFTYMPPSQPPPAQMTPETCLSKEAASKASTSSSNSSSVHSKSDTQAVLSPANHAKTHDLPPAKLSVDYAGQYTHPPRNVIISNGSSSAAQALPLVPLVGRVAVNQDDMAYAYAQQLQHTHRSRHSAYQSTTKPVQRQQEPLLTIPPLPPTFGIQPASQPLAVNHICRICLRRRSDRYHREHPISVDSNSPPPGICRRCRVTDVDERTKYVQLTQISESDRVCLGIECLFDKDELLTRQQVREAMRGERRHIDRERKSESSSDSSDTETGTKEPRSKGERVVYRYITMDQARESPSTTSAEVSTQNLAAMNLMNEQTIAQRGPSNLRNKVSVKVQTSEGPPARAARAAVNSVKVSNVARLDSKRASMRLHESKASRSGSSTTKASAQASIPVATVPTESEIRRIAREEVERYRQAERRLDTHPDAYAHGRMLPVDRTIPVERRIAVEREEIQIKPWEVKATAITVSEPIREHGQRIDPSKREFEVNKAPPSEGEGSIEVPSEDSRFWYRGVDQDTKSERSRSQAVVAETRGRPIESQSLSEPGWNLNMTRVANDNSKSSRQAGKTTRPLATVHETGVEKASPPSGRRLLDQEPRRIVEVYEETEFTLPRRQPIIEEKQLSRPGFKPVPSGSDRPRRLSVEVIREQEERTADLAHLAEMPTGSLQSSFRTDRECWEDGAVVQIASGLSMADPRSIVIRQRPDDVYSRDGRSSSSTSHKGPGVEQRIQGPDVVPVRSFRQAPEFSNRQARSNDESWYAERARKADMDRLPPALTELRGHKNDDERTIHPKALKSSQAPAPTRRSQGDAQRQGHAEWEYTERTIESVGRPQNGRIVDESAGRSYVETESLLRRGRPLTVQERMSSHILHSDANRQSSDRRHIARPSHLSNIYSDTSRPGRGREYYAHEAEQSAHVRFASKVEFSPTPLGSDESLPERRPGRDSVRDRDTRGDGRRLERRRSRGEDIRELIQDYERDGRDRRRSRLRGGGGGEQYSVVDEYVVEYTPSGETSQPQREDRSSHIERSSRHPAIQHQEEHRFLRHPMRATQVPSDRPLAHALSESPSRENLRREASISGVGPPSVRTERAIRSSHPDRGNDRRQKPDGAGPYREEIRSESMEAIWGSGHGGNLYLYKDARNGGRGE